jgi:hypothetical protein
VLCQQPLPDDGKRRLSAFESYVRGTLEVDAAGVSVSRILELNSAIPERRR